MTRSFAQISLSLWGARGGRTAGMWQAIMQTALEELDDKGIDEAVVLLVRGEEKGNIRITFKKEPEPKHKDQVTQYIVDDPHVVDFPNG